MTSSRSQLLGWRAMISPRQPITTSSTYPRNDLYLDPAAFANDFAADLPKDDAAFLARSQVFASKEAFSAKVGDPAWKTKQSWSIVASEDRSINPELEREMAKRAGSVVTEIKASHAVFASQAEKVADVIEAAARQVGAKSK